MVDFEWYRSFLAVYQTGTATAAASERGLTQPAITQHVAALEAAIGEALFTRTARRMIPTERGALLYNHIVQAVETLEHVSHGLCRPPPDVVPLVRLGTPRDYFAAMLLARLDAAPFRVAVQFGSARGLLEALQRGELDLVVATERLLLRSIEYRKLAEEHFVLVGATSLQPPVIQSPTAQHHAMLVAWLLKQRWISYGTDVPIIRRFWRHCFAQRPAIEPTLVIPDLLLISQAVAGGFGISVLPTYLCQTALDAGLLQIIWQPNQPITNDLWLAYRVADRQRPVILQALAALQPTMDG